MKKFIILLFVIGLFTSAPGASACSVMEGYPGTPQQNYDRNEVVFVGEVTSVIQDKSVYGDYRITFDVSKSYKGDVGKIATVKAAGSSAACGYDDAYSLFKTGTVWAIYADGDLRTSSVVANKNYATEKAALAELDELGKEPIACPMNYDPVCGRKDTGIRCVTTPCPSTEDKTYGNMCVLGAEKAEFLYKGECRAATPGPETAPDPGSPTPEPTPQDEPEVFPTTPPGTGEEAIVTAWQRFWSGLRRVIFFWRWAEP